MSNLMSKNNFLRTRCARGFSLVELLVVIAIISLLTSTMLASYDSVKKKNRDAKRQADLAQVSIALNLYYNENGLYPIGSCISSRAPNWNCWGSPDQLSNPATPGRLLPAQDIVNMPQDPLYWDAGTACSVQDGSRLYAYYSDDGKRYVLATRLEDIQPNDPHYINNPNYPGSCLTFANWAIKQGF